MLVEVPRIKAGEFPNRQAYTCLLDGERLLPDVSPAHVSHRLDVRRVTTSAYQRGAAAAWREQAVPDEGPGGSRL
jgi:hypothetical protein